MFCILSHVQGRSVSKKKKEITYAYSIFAVFLLIIVMLKLTFFLTSSKNAYTEGKKN